MQGYAPSQAGPKTPQKYPSVGPNYQQYGEQPGWIYYPWTDQYYVDPKASKEYAEQAGYAPDEPPSQKEQLGAMALGSGLMAGVSGLASDPGGFIGGITGLFGKKKAAETIGQEVAQTAASAPIASPTVTTGSGSGLLGGATTTAPDAFGGVASGPAQNMTPMAQPGFFGNVAANAAGMGALPLAGIAIGTGLIGSGANKLLKGKDMNLPERASLGIATGGLSEVAKGLGIFSGPKNYHKANAKQAEKLQSKGIFIPQNLMDYWKNPPKNAGYRDDQGADFVGNDTAGAWVNNKFAKSRDEKDLVWQDIVNAPIFAERDPEWFNKPLEERQKIVQPYLDQGKVSEGKGKIKVDFDE